MGKGLSIDRIVRVSVNLQPKAAARRNFGVLCIVGSSDVIDITERVRYYTGITGITEDFGVEAPEYMAAQVFFSQSPRPYILAIGRFDKENETFLQCVATLADVSGDWYGITFTDTLTAEEHIAVAGYIEASAKSRMYFITSGEEGILSATSTTDIASKIKELNYQRTFIQYSSFSPYAACASAGRAFTVNFNANRSTITLKFKQNIGVQGENLTETQAQNLFAKRVNVFVKYDNDTAILQEGTVSSGAFFDEIHGLDWLQNAVQNECYNLLYQSKTKIPQTEQGITQIVATIAKVMQEAINNGLIAPGIWNADGFGTLERGDMLQEGYYIYSGPLAEQPQSEREQRKAPPIQVAVKLAGAVHFVDVQIDVNR